MLSTERLEVAKLHTSKNTYLQQLFAAVKDYNQTSVLPGAPLAKKAEKLQRVIVHAGGYLTSKPPHPGKHKPVGTSIMRWNALNQLVKEAGREADRLNIRLLRSPTDVRKISGKNDCECVWLEVIDPHHRHGGDLSHRWQSWITDRVSIDEKRSFWEFIGTPDTYNSDLELEVLKYYRGEKHRTHFEGQKLLDSDGVPVDTTEMKSLCSGRFWGIFALSVRRVLYIGQHSRGIFHHSSFLSGEPVLAAGEIVVVDGTIAAISNKTGHYWTQPAQLRSMLIALQEIPDTVLISSNASAGVRDRTYHRCGDYRRLGNQARIVANSELAPHINKLIQGKPGYISPTVDDRVESSYKRNQVAEE